MTKMSNKGKKINDAIDWLIVGAAIYFTTITIAGIAKWKRTHGVGKVERIKRRIYKEVSLAQDAGIDFTKKVDELNDRDRELLDNLGANAGWKQSKRSVESGKPYADAYYGSLRRAWNAVSGLGIRGIGRTYKVKDADGNTVLTWIEDAAAHVEAERRTLEAEKRAAESRRNLRKNRRERRNQTPVVVSPSVPEIVENYAEEDIYEPEQKKPEDPVYSLSRLQTYVSSVPVFDAQVNLTPEDMYKGYLHVMCGDAQGGRSFYVSRKNLPILKEAVEQNGGEYEEAMYLPF